MSWALAALQVVLASTLYLAAVGKLLRADEFVSALRLSHLPEGMVRLLAYLVPSLEVGLATWLVLAQSSALPAAFVAVLGLLALFTTWMVWVWARQLRVRCGCFGPNGGQVGRGTIARNLCLMLAAVLGWLGATTGESALAGPSLWLLLMTLGLAAAIAMLSALRFAWPHLTLTDERLRAGGTVGEY